MADRAELSERFAAFADTTASRAPLYSVLSRWMATDDKRLGQLDLAPAIQMPVLLFAAVHDLVLATPDVALAQWYATATPDPRPAADPDLAAAWTTFLDEHHDDIVQLVTTRATQTNEIGRCGLFIPVLATLDAEVGPLSLVDVGTSAGLNLLLDRYAYRYTPRHGGATITLGTSSVTLDISTSGAVPVPARLPRITGRLGIDHDPIDVADPDAARWLQACVWPDQLDRFARLSAAIELARRNPPPVRRGDAVMSLAAAVADVRPHGHPVVVNSWVLNYLTGDQRLAYVDALDHLGAAGDLSWLFAESPFQTPELPVAADLADSQLTALSLVRWRDGVRTEHHLATCHPHGYWLDWRA